MAYRTACANCSGDPVSTWAPVPCIVREARELAPQMVLMADQTLQGESALGHRDGPDADGRWPDGPGCAPDYRNPLAANAP
jgi:hypothetical protein